MNELEKKIQSIVDEVDSLQDGIAKARLGVVKAAEILSNLKDTGKLDGLINMYYTYMKRYAKERAYFVEGSLSNVDFYDIKEGSFWQTVSTNFTFPSKNEWIVYGLTFDGVVFTPNPTIHKIIQFTDGKRLARPLDIKLLQTPSDQIEVTFQMSQSVVAGVVHDKMTLLDFELEEAPELESRFVILNRDDGSVLGEGVVSTEGLTLNPSWDRLQPLDYTDQAMLDEWFSTCMAVPQEDFIALCGDLFSTPRDDIFKSADPSINSDSSEPYTQDKLERSPFFPSFNSEEDDRPTDMDAVDTINRKQIIDNAPVWGVYPKFRWQGYVTPPLSADPKVERFVPPKAIDAVSVTQSTPISQSEFPTNVIDITGLGGDTTYHWVSSTDLIIDASSGNVVNCTYNSISPLIGTFLRPLLNGFTEARSLCQTFVNDKDSSQAQSDLDIIPVFDDLISKLQAAVNHHDSWFSPSDDRNDGTFSGSIGIYNQSHYNAVRTALQTHQAALSDRFSNLTDIIGDVDQRTGYVGEVIKSVDVLVNKNYGVLRDVFSKFNRIPQTKNTMIKARKAYDALS